MAKAEFTTDDLVKLAKIMTALTISDGHENVFIKKVKLIDQNGEKFGHIRFDDLLGKYVYVVE